MYSTTGNRSGMVFDSFIRLSLHLSSRRVIVMIWTAGLSLAIPPLIGWSHYSPEPNGLSCSPSWADPESKSFIIYIFMIGFVVPNIVITFTSVQVVNIHKENSINASGRIAEMVAKRQK